MGREAVSDFIVVDTDVFIEAGRGVGEAVACLQEIERQASVSLSVIAYMEMLAGCRNRNELHDLNRVLSRYRVLPVNEAISGVALDLLRRYRLSHGLMIPDALIAATALSYRYPLVTRNQRDYRFIAGLDLLSYPHPFAA
jgi:hypothetical protein